MKKILIGLCIAAVSAVALSGGNPAFVEIPMNYQETFTEYDTINRKNGKQLAVLYANDIAINSAASGKLNDGAIIVMEIYKAKKDANGDFITNDNGLLEKGAHAATAIMEKKQNWSKDFSASDRSEDWGYAIYKANGSIKQNDLDCVGCHEPYKSTEYMFSYTNLLQHVTE